MSRQNMPCHTYHGILCHNMSYVMTITANCKLCTWNTSEIVNGHTICLYLWNVPCIVMDTDEFLCPEV